MNELDCVSPIDGRYRRHSAPLAAYFSESALIKFRVRTEVEYLLALCGAGIAPRLSASGGKKLAALAAISGEEAALVKKIETRGHAGIPATNHDVKAVEYFIRLRLKKLSLSGLSEWVHFALTSEDTNNIASALMLRGALESEIIPMLRAVRREISGLARRHAAAPLLARTHGQSAVPTTFGKEFRVFSERLERQIRQMESARLPAKLNGAAGNYNAHHAALPDTDWLEFSRGFIARLNAGRRIKLEANLFTTQIEPHDGLAEILDCMRRANTVLLDFSQDMWRYISDGLITQRAAPGEIGSSTMPQKVNPIDFENAEGNIGMANAMFSFFSAKLPVSRLQRDLSDSTTQRNIGAAFAHSRIAYVSLLRGLGKTEICEAAALSMLDNAPEVVTEGIQTILRREGVKGGYEKMKALSRGRKISLSDIAAFIDGLDAAPEVKTELKSLTPRTYTGLSAKIARL
ncbi:MAG: adenylosuccinate lyase [Elusimicrobiales bacterium]